jgi:hypothetical protein
MPLDVTAGSAGRGDGDAVLRRDLVGVGLDGDPRGLARVREADLDPLADDVVAEADVPGRADGPLEFDDAARRGRQGAGPAGTAPAAVSRAMSQRWSRDGTALKARLRRRSVACLLVSARDAGSA